MTRVSTILILGLVLIWQGGCTANEPIPSASRPPAQASGPSGAEAPAATPAAPAPASPPASRPSGAPVLDPPASQQAAPRPAGLSEVALKSMQKVGDVNGYRVAILEALARPDNPLKLDEKAYKDLAQILLDLSAADNHLTYAQVHIMQALTPEQRAEAAKVPDQEDPEQALLDKGPALLKTLQAKAGSSSPGDLAKVPEEYTPEPGLDPGLTPSQTLVFLEKVAPSLTAEQAARIAPEVQRMMEAAPKQQAAWWALASLVHANGRDEALQALLPKPEQMEKAFDMGKLLEGASKVVFVHAGWPEDGPPDQT